MTTTTTTGSGQNYTVNLCYYPDEPIYDFDELVCMYHQFLAIEFGWADPIKVHIVDDIAGVSYKWEPKIEQRQEELAEDKWCVKCKSYHTKAVGHKPQQEPREECINWPPLIMDDTRELYCQGWNDGVCACMRAIKENKNEMA